ncbi:hypothetical protein A0J61_07297 [Choanephora cucurbitarum]|uniref:F-box domain-containing protein n=1 Tax=Choanephora cucurbitarum TaxID=101091 RepID=A0A1C7N6L3_9FUNG|nr:hypothetical protein A0J61_07297 [Choanephora cucurbitarum]
MSLNDRIPKEIWAEIFKQLPDKRQIKTCRLVCQAWDRASSFYFAEGIQVRLGEYDLDRFLEDLSLFDKLGPRITQLSLQGRLKVRIRSMILQPIIGYCPNLEWIRLEKKSAFSYILNLLDTADRLSHVKQVQIVHLKTCSPSERRLHAALNCRLCDTIRQLELVDINLNRVILSHGGLLAYLQYFHHLTDLKVGASIKGEVISLDLVLLSQSCPTLKKVALVGYQLMSHVSCLEPAAQLEYLVFEHTKLTLRVLEWIERCHLYHLCLKNAMVLPGHATEEIIKRFLLLYRQINTDQLIFWSDGWMYFMTPLDDTEEMPIYKIPCERLIVTEDLLYQDLFKSTDDKIRVV